MNATPARTSSPSASRATPLPTTASLWVRTSTAAPISANMRGCATAVHSAARQSPVL